MGFLDKFKSLFGGGQKEEKPAAEVQEPVSVAETPAEEIAAEEPASSGKYYTLACSHVGFSHTKTGTPCQDYTSKVDEEDFHILTVSDGHGSSNFVRSDRGSRFACEAAEAAMRQFAAEIDPAEQTADRTARVADVVDLDLCLDAVYDALDLVIGKVNAEQGFHCCDRIALELCQQILVVLDLVGQFFNFCFDVHDVTPVFLKITA